MCLYFQIADPFQVLVAANRAVHLNKTGKMTTKNVHSEVLFCLSASKNVRISILTSFPFALEPLLVLSLILVILYQCTCIKYKVFISYCFTIYLYSFLAASVLLEVFH